MLCPKCNLELSEDGVCPNCATASMPAAPVSKEAFLARYAPKDVKRTGWIARALAAFCAIFFLLGAVINLNMPIFDIPVINLVLGDDVNWSAEEMKEMVQEADALIAEYEGVISEKEMKVLDKFVKTVEDFAEKPSISNIKKLSKASMDVYKISAVDNAEVDQIGDTVTSVFNGIATAIWVIAIVLAALALLAGWRFGSGWLIAAMILNIGPGFALVGWWYVLLSTAGCIAFIVFNKKFNNAFNGFNYNIKNQ